MSQEISNPNIRSLLTSIDRLVNELSAHQAAVETALKELDLAWEAKEHIDCREHIYKAQFILKALK
jgi:hypothetical protein